MSAARSLPFLVAVALLLVACGDDDAAEPAPTTVAGSTAPATPQLELTVEDLEGFEGRIVVGILSPTGGPGPVGSVCLPVDAGRWTGTAVFSTFDPENPCGKDAPFGEVIDAEGDYSLDVGVLVPGSPAPDACLETTVTLAGPTAVTVDAADLVTDCDW